MNNKIQLALKGMAMGIAEVIPGVSGGTIAFITGIYEQLLNSINAFGPSLITDFREGGVKKVWKSIDGNFLVSLLFGMAVGMIIGVFGVSHLLENYPPLIWAFFFGLIIASTIYIGKQIEKWNWKNIISLVLGAIVAYGITVLTPAEGSTSLIFVFFCGAIAISALILPGISGSFILLMLGMYSYIVTETVKPALSTFATDKLIVMGVFALGCLTSLMTISRALSWTFNNYRSITLSVLTGFMLGSLNKIWPWRNAVEWLRDASGNIIMKDGLPKKILIEENVFPSAYDGGDPYVLGVIVLVVIGFLSVFAIERLGKK